jgi:hypothetical protein
MILHTFFVNGPLKKWRSHENAGEVCLLTKPVSVLILTDCDPLRISIRQLGTILSVPVAICKQYAHYRIIRTGIWLCLNPEVTTLVVRMPFQLGGGKETNQSLTISHTISIQFDMAFWDESCPFRTRKLAHSKHWYLENYGRFILAVVMESPFCVA